MAYRGRVACERVLGKMAAIAEAAKPGMASGLPGFSGTTNLSATPGRPACPSRASGWSSLTTPWGFPCFVRFPCVHAAANTPVQQLGVIFAHSPSHFSLPRYGSRVGLHIVLFEACSAFTRVAACTLALSPIRDTLIEGFSHFVTSMTAPIASGWSGCRVGLAPTGKAPPFHGARQKRTSVEYLEVHIQRASYPASIAPAPRKPAFLNI